MKFETMSLNLFYIRCFLVILISNASLSLHAQQKSFYLIDSLTTNSIVDAFIYSDEYNTISDQNGLFELPATLKSYTFIISHINYKVSEVDFSNIESGDTLFLNEVVNIIDEVTIRSTREEQSFEWLFKLLNTYKEKDASDKLRYTYILKSRLNDEIVENLHAEIDLDYVVGSENTFQNSYARSGFFWFNPTAPFLNLQTEQLLFSLDPFHFTKNSLKLITARKNKKSDFVSYQSCDNCSENQVRVNLQSKDKRQTVSMLIDTSKQIINEANYSVTDCSDAKFYGITDGNLLKVNSIDLKYQFDSIGFPTMIRAQFSMEKDASEVTVNCLLVKKDTIEENGANLIVLGRPNFDNIYEQILFNPEVTSELSNVVKKGLSKDTINLSSFNPKLRKPFLESNFSVKKLKLLSSYYNSLPLETSLVTKEFYVDAYGVKKNFDSVLRIYQPFKLQETEIGYRLYSTYPIIDLTNSRIFTESTDPYYNQIVIMLFAYMYEVDRKKTIDEVSNYTTMNKDQILQLLNKQFDTKARLYNSDLSKFLVGDGELKEILIMNKEIEEYLGFNVINSVLQNDYSCEECKEGLLSEIIRLGYKSKDRNPHFSALCFQQSLSIFHLFLNQLSKEDQEFKIRKGSYFSRMADLYIEIEDMKNACSCLKKYKLHWPNGFAESGKKNYYFEHCDE